VSDGKKLGTNLDSALKEWIDRVIVPGMVRVFLSQHQKGDSLNLRVVPNFGQHEPSAEGSQ